MMMVMAVMLMASSVLIVFPFSLFLMRLLYHNAGCLSTLVCEILVPDPPDVLFFANVIDYVSIVWDLWCVWDGLGD